MKTSDIQAVNGSTTASSQFEKHEPLALDKMWNVSTCLIPFDDHYEWLTYYFTQFPAAQSHRTKLASGVELKCVLLFD